MTNQMSPISIEENNGKHQIEIDLWDGGNVYAAPDASEMDSNGDEGAKE